MPWLWWRRARSCAPFHSLPDIAVAAILARLPAEDVGSLSAASRAWRRAVAAALDALAPVAVVAAPSLPPRAFFCNVGRLHLLPRWPLAADGFASGGGGEGCALGLPEVLRGLPLLRELSVDLGRRANDEAAEEPPARLCSRGCWPPGLTALTLLNAGRDDLAAVDASPTLRRGLRALTLLPLVGPPAMLAVGPYVLYAGGSADSDDEEEAGGAARASLAGFTALRELRATVPAGLLWNLSRETLAGLTSLRLRVADAPGGILLPAALPPAAATCAAVAAAAAADPDRAARPLGLVAPSAARVLLLHGPWPNLRHLEVPDDAFCFWPIPRREDTAEPPPAMPPAAATWLLPPPPSPPTPPPPPLPPLFSDAFPNLEALSVATTPARAPALAAGLCGLRSLRRLVIRRVHGREPGAVAAAALNGAAALYHRAGGRASSHEGARTLAHGGLAPLARALVPLELIVGLAGWPGEPSWDALEARAHAAAFGGADGGGGGGGGAFTHPQLLEVDEDDGGGDDGALRSEEEPPAPPPPALIARGSRIEAPWPVPGLPQLRAWGGGGSGGGGYGSSSNNNNNSTNRLAVLTAANGSGSLVIASPHPGLPIARCAPPDERLGAAERALFSLAPPPPPLPQGQQQQQQQQQQEHQWGWRHDGRALGRPLPPPARLATAQELLQHARLLPAAALRGRLLRLELDAPELLAGSAGPPTPLLFALPRLRVLHVRAADAEDEASAAAAAAEVWEVLSAGERGGGGGAGSALSSFGRGGGLLRSGSGAGLLLAGASPARRPRASSFGAALADAAADAAALAAATGNNAAAAANTRPSSSSLSAPPPPPPTATQRRLLPPIEWLRLEGFPDAGSSPASLRALSSYGRTLRALEIVGADRAPPAAPLVELLSRRCSPGLRYLAVEGTALPAGWLRQVASLLSEPRAHVASAAWVAHVLVALPGLPTAVALVAALAAAAVRQAPRLAEMIITAQLAAVAAMLVTTLAAARVWALAAAEAVSRGGVPEAPGAALAGRLRLLSLRGCTAEDPAEPSSAAGAAAAAFSSSSSPPPPPPPDRSALVALARACPRLRFLDLLYFNASAAELAALRLPQPTETCPPGLFGRRPRRRWGWRRPPLAYVNTDQRSSCRARGAAPAARAGLPVMVCAPEGLAATVLEREVWLNEALGE